MLNKLGPVFLTFVIKLVKIPFESQQNKNTYSLLLHIYLIGGILRALIQYVIGNELKMTKSLSLPCCVFSSFRRH